MNDVKAEFLAYLRSVYGNQPMPTLTASFPPIMVGATYPTFAKASVNEGLGMMAGMAPMGMPMGGMQQPGVLSQPTGMAPQGMQQSGLAAGLGMLSR